MPKRNLPALLRELRIEAGLTQGEVASRVGQSQSYVSKYESGEQRLDLSEIEGICSALGIGLREMIERYLES